MKACIRFLGMLLALFMLATCMVYNYDLSDHSSFPGLGAGI